MTRSSRPSCGSLWRREWQGVRTPARRQSRLPIRGSRHSEWCCPLASSWATPTVTRTITTPRQKSTGGSRSQLSLTPTVSTPSLCPGPGTSRQSASDMDRSSGSTGTCAATTLCPTSQPTPASPSTPASSPWRTTTR